MSSTSSAPPNTPSTEGRSADYLSDPTLPAPGVLESLAPDVPAPVQEAMNRGAALSIQISGGKDSQAMLWLLAALYRREGWAGPCYAVHADLDGTEWPQTRPHVERVCSEAGIPLEIVGREGGLTGRIRERKEKLEGTGRPFWPSAQSRYCTSDCKRSPADKLMRRHRGLVVCALGLRAEESDARAGKEVLSVRSSITTKRLKNTPPTRALHQWQRLQRLGAQGFRAGMSYNYPDGAGRYRGSGIGGRLALEWLPLLHMAERDVWRACGTSLNEVERRRTLTARGREREALKGFSAHGCYALGNRRCSCVLCVLGSRNDLVNGALRNPDAFDEWREMERASGISFRQDVSLEEIGREAERVRQGQATLPRFRQPSLFCPHPHGQAPERDASWPLRQERHEALVASSKKDYLPDTSLSPFLS